ncbi:hypothetical protein CPter91_0623 [Collimonas pratensis]|uniref:Uncharacterized protein n=2 Tax=Collimonas pratensis TaxID=279113 RepID=A0A127PYZ6_9BURK|nr:hypothetical protein CPter91_0623 [Collimonas pratensis]
MLEKYRQAFKNSAYPIKYIFVDANGENRDGSCCSSDVPKKIYMVNILAKESSEFIYSPEVNRLIKQDFEITIDDKSIISMPKADYLILRMSRPPEYNPKSAGCAAGMGEDRAYLIAIKNNGISVLNRNFFNCSGSYRMVHVNGQPGYEIRDYKKGSDQAQSVLYILQDGQLVRKENGPYKEAAQ